MAVLARKQRESTDFIQRSMSTGEVHLGRNAAIISGMVWLYFFISRGGGRRHLSVSWIHICVTCLSLLYKNLWGPFINSDINMQMYTQRPGKKMGRWAACK